MKIKNTEDVLQYPEAYDFLTEDQQVEIVNYMNAMQDLAQRYYETHLEYEEYEEDEEKHETYLKLYNQTINELIDAKSTYMTAGVYVEYNWPGYYHKWILATRADAQAYLDAADHPYPLESEAEGDLINPLLSYEDVY